MQSVKLLTRFDGKGDVLAWLRKAELIVDGRKEDPAQVIPACLEGAAFAVFEQMDSADRSDFAKIRKRLVLAFGLTPYEAFTSFKNLVMQPFDNADAFASSVTRLGSLCGITDDVGLACKFIDGLPSDIKKEVMLRMGLAPTLREAVVAAQLLLPGSNSRSDVGFLGRKMSRLDVNGSGGGSGRDQKKMVDVRRCFNCNSVDHLAAQCKTIKCFRCGRIGHTSRICPASSCSENSGNGGGEVPRSQLQGNLPRTS